MNCFFYEKTFANVTKRASITPTAKNKTIHNQFKDVVWYNI